MFRTTLNELAVYKSGFRAAFSFETAFAQVVHGSLVPKY
jgi:hypothetical protein